MVDWWQLDISFVNEKWVGMKWLHPYLSDSGRSVLYFSLPATNLQFIVMHLLFYFHLSFFNYVFCQVWLLLVGSYVPFIISNHCPPKFTTAYQFPDILAAGPPDQGRDPYSSSSKQPWTTITEREHLSISILGLGDFKRCKKYKDGEHLRPNFCQPCAYWHRGCS